MDEIDESTHEKEMKETLKWLECHVCNIRHRTDNGRLNTNRPYTLRPDLVPEEITQGDISKSIKAWDYVGDRVVELKHSSADEDYSIKQVCMHDLSVDHVCHKAGTKNKKNLEYALKEKEKALADFSECSTKYMDQQSIENLYFCVDMTPEIWDFLKTFEFAISLESIKHITDKDMEKSRQVWMDTIRKYRTDAFAELDTLEEEAKAESDSDDDLADIDTIKQMFRDIPQDADLSIYKDIDGLIQFWPSLMLPAPSFVGDVGKKLKKVTDKLKVLDSSSDDDEDDHRSDSVPANELVQILDNIDDVDFLKKEIEDIGFKHLMDLKYAEYYGSLADRLNQLGEESFVEALNKKHNG